MPPPSSIQFTASSVEFLSSNYLSSPIPLAPSRSPSPILVISLLDHGKVSPLTTSGRSALTCLFTPQSNLVGSAGQPSDRSPCKIPSVAPIAFQIRAKILRRPQSPTSPRLILSGSLTFSHMNLFPVPQQHLTPSYLWAFADASPQPKTLHLCPVNSSHSSDICLTGISSQNLFLTSSPKIRPQFHDKF